MRSWAGLRIETACGGRGMSAGGLPGADCALMLTVLSRRRQEARRTAPSIRKHGAELIDRISGLFETTCPDLFVGIVIAMMFRHDGVASHHGTTTEYLP